MRRPFAILFLCTALLAGFGCTSRPSGPAGKGGSKADDDRIDGGPVVVTELASVAEVDGELVVELGVGAAQEIAVGDLFRVYAADPGSRLKGMLQITAVVDEERALARQIGLLDRTHPLAAGDEARLVRNLAALADTRAVEDAIARERARLDAAAAEDGEEFAALREHYGERLAELDRRHHAAVARLERAHQQELQARAARYQRERERRAAEHKADLATLRATLSDEAAAALRRDRHDLEQRIRELEAQKRKLGDQVATLVAEAQQAERRIGELLADAAAGKRRQQTELRAEIETREVLQERVDELERRVAGRTTTTTSTILTNDADRDETVLERLRRVIGERDAARARIDELEADLAHQGRVHQRRAERLEELETTVATLREQTGQQQDHARRIAELEDETQRLRATSQGLELVRLRAERAYYDLAARILRLPGEQAPLVDLQRRLRRVLAGDEARPLSPGDTDDGRGDDGDGAPPDTASQEGAE